MKKVLFLLACLFAGDAGLAQVYSLAEAERIAYQLCEKEIISPKGLSVFLAAVRATGAQENATPQPVLRRTVMLHPTREPGPQIEERSAATVLAFLSRLFLIESGYRQAFEERDSISAAHYPRASSHHFSAEQRAASHRLTNEEIRAKWHTFPGPKIEAALPVEDPLSTAGMTRYGGFGHIPESDIGLVHPSRSATGKMRTRLLRDLQSLALVDERTVAEILPRIADNILRDEAAVLNAAANLVGYRQDEGKLELVAQYSQRESLYDSPQTMGWDILPAPVMVFHDRSKRRLIIWHGAGGEVEMRDVLGRVRYNIPLQASAGSLQVSTDVFPGGVYTYHWRRGNERMSAGRVVVL